MLCRKKNNISKISWFLESLEMHNYKQYNNNNNNMRDCSFTFSYVTVDWIT